MNLGGIFSGVGAGLGQAATNYQQQRDAQMRDQIAQIYLANQRRQQQAKELEGLALGSGLDVFGGNKPIGLPGSTPTTLPGAAAAPPQMPQAGGGQASGGPMTGGTPTAVMPLDRTPQGEVMADARADTLGVPVLDAEAGEAAKPETAAAPPPAGTGDAGPAAASAGGGNLMVTMPGGQQMDLGTLFQRVDPGMIAQRIKQIRPDAAPDAIAMATENLYKLAQSGDRSQQMATATLLKYLMPTANFSLGEAGRSARAEQSSADRNRSTDVREGLGKGNLAERSRATDVRERLGEGNLTERKAGREQRAQQFVQRMAQAEAGRSGTDRRSSYNTILRDIDRQLYPGLGAQQPSDEERAELQRQRTEVVGKLRALSGMGPLPAPRSSPLPGGGAAAPIPPPSGP